MENDMVFLMVFGLVLLDYVVLSVIIQGSLKGRRKPVSHNGLIYTLDTWILSSIGMRTLFHYLPLSSLHRTLSLPARDLTA
jgi:hypothetical protein